MDLIGPLSVPLGLIDLFMAHHIALELPVTVKGTVLDLIQMLMDGESFQGNLIEYSFLSSNFSFIVDQDL